MRILVVTQRNSGVGYHRLMLPIYYMDKDYAMFTDTLNDEILSENFDILLINRFIYNIELEQILSFKKKYNFKLIVDIDDYWILDTWHILYRFYPTDKIISHIKIADFVTCTNELLYNEIKSINSNVEILPNALPYGKDQFTLDRIYNDKTTIVYAGSVTHEKDIALLRNPFKRIHSDKILKDKTNFIICGYDDNNDRTKSVWHKMIHSYTYGLKLNCVIRKAKPVDEYMNFYNDADITLAPLVYSRFNSMKSNLKVLEGASKKAPTIASNVPPYNDCPIIPINNATDWYKKIKYCIDNKNFIIDKGAMSYEWATSCYNLNKINTKRNQLYKSILK